MSITKWFSDYLKATKYNIGFVEEDLHAVVEGHPIHINWLKHSYKDRWFADPFILDVTDNDIIVLVEEWYDPIQRGRISKLVVDKKTFRLKGLKVMIDEGFHLSFPAITRKADGIYIQPECGKTRGLVEYKYNAEQDIFEKQKVISDLPLADSVRNSLFGEDLMFSTKLPDANGKELGIYSWDEVTQQYQPKDFYRFPENISRMAGNFFVCDGEIYRPAQVCIKWYGDAVSIQKVTHENNKWHFEEIRRMYSPNHDLDLGFHTFNEYKGFIVVDALGYRRAKLCHFLKNLRSTVSGKCK
jgi:hypothetical protein